MKKVHVKFLLLAGNGLGPALKIRSGNIVLARLPSASSCVLDIPEGQNLTFLYSFPYRTTIQLPEDKDEIFIVVYYSVREYFPAIVLDAFRKLVVVKVVDEEEFNQANREDYKKAINPKPDFEQNKAVLIIGFLLSFIYTLLPFNLLKGQENNRDLSFFIGIMGVIGFAMLIEEKKLIHLKEYKARVLVFSVFSIALDIIFPISAFMKYTLLLATGTLILQVLRMKPKGKVKEGQK